jgi:tetratricopeptide (TPR) repeat protein
LAAAVLAAAVALLYTPALGFEFLSYDDPVYVTRNPQVTGGLTAASVRWAFTNAHAGNWHPLTWLSHMLDVEWLGLEPRGHHATNVLLHALNAVLLFLVLEALTGRRGRSFAVAALFALHPIQLESVAWVAERKNLLSTGFGLLAIGAHASWARRGGALRYAAVAALVAASLMAKPMLVTLPFVLLLLDVWPLGRAAGTGSARRIVVEKLPLLALSAGVSVLVYATQARAGAMEPASGVPLLVRLAYAPVACVGYLEHVAWPEGLAVLYPHPLLAPHASLGAAAVLLAAALLAVISTLAVAAARRGRPAALIGWLWFLGTLVPVIGVVQVGWQGLADRYAYVPLIGLLVAIVWSAADGLERALRGWTRSAVAAGSLATACALLALASSAQLPHWRGSRALFERALAVTGPNPVMHNELGVLLAGAGDYAQALPHFEQAAAQAPGWSAAHQNLGALLARLGRPDQGLVHLELAVSLDPEHAPGLVALASALLALGRSEQARPHVERALALDPTNARALALRARLGEVTPPLRSAQPQ